MNAAKKLREYLIEHGITQTWLSKETKIPVPRLNLILHEKRLMKLTELEIICGVLEVPVTFFVSPRKPEFTTVKRSKK